jgi:hypothetical protein
MASATSDSQDDGLRHAVGSEPDDPAEGVVVMPSASSDEGMRPTDGVGERLDLSPTPPPNPATEPTADHGHGALDFAVMDEAWFSAPRLNGKAGPP